MILCVIFIHLPLAKLQNNFLDGAAYKKYIIIIIQIMRTSNFSDCVILKTSYIRDMFDLNFRHIRFKSHRGCIVGVNEWYTYEVFSDPFIYTFPFFLQIFIHAIQ